jgi:hypothetical protein
MKLAAMVGMNLFGYEMRNCRKPSGFQSFATLLPVEFILSGRDAKTASTCGVKALNRATARFSHFSWQLIAVCRAITAYFTRV